MTRSERIQWQIFILLIVALCASIYYFSGTSKKTVSEFNTRRVPARSSLVTEDALPEVSMLKQKLPEFNGVKRNVFEFADGSSVEEILLTEKQPLFIPKTTPSTPEGPDVTYLGFYHEKEGSERKLAAISNGGQIYVGGPGEILAGKYKVLRVDDEFIEIEYLSENRVIRLEIGRNGHPPPLP